MTEHDEPRAVRRARVRMLRGGRNGARAAVVAATYDARRAVDRALGARRVKLEKQSRSGRMPHVPSGRHQKKLADRKDARRGAAAA